MILSGKIVEAPVSGGRLLLETPAGERYALAGSTDFEIGQRVTLEGALQPPAQSVGIGMTGDPVFCVAGCSAGD